MQKIGAGIQADPAALGTFTAPSRGEAVVCARTAKGIPGAGLPGFRTRRKRAARRRNN